MVQGSIEGAHHLEAFLLKWQFSMLQVGDLGIAYCILEDTHLVGPGADLGVDSSVDPGVNPGVGIRLQTLYVAVRTPPT